MRRSFFVILLVFSVLISNSIFAQGSEQYGAGMKVNIDSSGSKYIKFQLWNQTWLRFAQNNPGTSINGNPQSDVWDIGARRLRFIILAQINPRYLIVAHFGVNNQSFLNGGAASSTTLSGGYGPGKKPGLFFHDAWNEYALVPAQKRDGTNSKFSMYLGAGLHYWNGVSRMSSASTVNFLTLDAPIFNFPLIESSDQFGRQFGIYTKGRISKIGYQFSVNKPFLTNQLMSTSPNVAVDRNNGKPAFSGYSDYQFLDQEANVLPYRVGTYMGTKKVFNIGAGFYHNAQATESWIDTTSTNKKSAKHNIFLYAVDVFADLPIGPKEKNMAITSYTVFYNYNFGPNYIRSIGIMNIGSFDSTFTGVRAADGIGNAQYKIGTGGIFYSQAGLLLPKQISSKFRIQPFAALAIKNFNAVNEGALNWDIGTNFFIDGNQAKITAQYSSRPLFDQVNKKVFDRKGEFIIQFQISL